MLPIVDINVHKVFFDV